MNIRSLALLSLVGFAGCVAGDGADVVADEAKSTSSEPVLARRVPAQPSAAAEGMPVRSLGYVSPDFDTEDYARIDESEFQSTSRHPLSTFSIDVDTASYANVRRFLGENRLPPADAVRIEELINYFPYAYEPPAGDAPFAVHTEVTGCPWEPSHRLVRIGLKAREIPVAERPPSNLVFLIDVSGSMQTENKLPLVKRALRLLVEQLRDDDRVALAVYAGSSGLVLPPTSGEHKEQILSAIDRLEAGGSTNGADGIELAYRTAEAAFRKGGTNRVILATDGDFNVGVTSEGELTRLIEEKAKGGVFLSVLGFGTGNLKDSTMEQLADRGNGNYAYIDGINEAKKALVEQLTGTLLTVAKDVKIQVEFNPAQAASYRLVGYENRKLADEDFRDDAKDAGEIGAGHTVTALYEVIPAGAGDAGRPVDPLKYQTERAPAAKSDELLTVKLRYKTPEGSESIPLEFPVRDAGAAFASASAESRFAAAVAEFAMVLRQSPHRGIATWESVISLAVDAGASTGDEHRREFVELAKKAKALAAPIGS